MSTTTKCKFNPVQCLDETFQTLSPREGYLYFVTDKKKIFLGQEGKMIPMCATSGFFYGTKEISYDNSGIAPDSNVIFYFDEIEGDDIPEIDDLILNIDGCFYRVKDVEENELETIRLTLQGTGGGGSNSGTTGGSWSISPIGGKNKAYASNTKEMTITFIANYDGDTSTNYISSVAFKRLGDEEPFYTVYENISFNTNYSIDIFNYKNLFNTNKTTVTMYVYDLYGKERSINLTVQLIDLSLEPIEQNIITGFSNTYTYKCKLIGATSGIIQKQLTYSLYRENDMTKPVLERIKVLNVTDEDEIQHNLDLTALTQGVYVLKVKATAKISGMIEDLQSNVLTHKFAYFKASNNEPLLAVHIPETIEQHTNIPINYVVLTEEANQDYTINFSLNGSHQATLTTKSNVIDQYNLYFENKGTYTLTVSVLQLNLSFNTYLNVQSYTGNLPVIDGSRDDLMLYLNPRNKSNNAVDKNEWSDYNGAYTGTLKDFSYGTANGWLIDENGVNYLKLTSGAKFEMKDFRPFEKDPTELHSSDSRMGSGMTIELDFEINGVLDYDNELISCLSKTKDGVSKVGFSVTGDKISFNSNRTKLLSLNLVEGKRTRVSFVIEPKSIEFPMVYAYLNGKLSGAVILNDDSFSDSIQRPAQLFINSDVAQIKIYSIRFYTSALNDRMILNNYTASLATLTEKQNAYDLNNVFSFNESKRDYDIDYIKVSAEDYNLQIPYMLLTGGYATEQESKWQRKDINDTSARLPYGKKDYRMVDVKVKYPKVKNDNDPNDPNIYFKDYQDYEFINRFASGKPMSLAYGEKPLNGGAIMYAQGTSSMEYPVKNLRLRFKNREDWYTVRPDISPVEIICMKADYMESSGSHNTGAANLIDALYQGVGIKTPGQAEFGGEGKPTVVTCIKGHPCLIFYSATGEEGSYEFIGKYNLNLDKATPKPFGFDHSDDFGWLKEGDEYYSVLYGDKKENFSDTFIGQANPDSDGDYYPNQQEQSLQVKSGDKINSIHCFEFLDNAVEVCNFLNKYKGVIEDPENPGQYIPDPNGETYTYAETWYNTFTNKDGDNVPGWTLGFESRYPEGRVGYHDADSLYPLASWINELNELRKTDSKQANARFKNEYQCYLNKEFLITYYLISEALLMVDSRVKNMMIATWGKENNERNNDKYSYYPLKETEPGVWEPDTTQEKIIKNEYIFYPIFYDMDTMLGLDNTGVYRFNYYDEDTSPDLYNGSEVLWTFVRDTLTEEFRTWYTNLETAALTPNQALTYFNKNQANLANEAFYNGDSKYKYINPARNGYHDYLYDKEIAPGAGPYLYAAQGDRSLMREWFINNRFKFLSGKYASGQFKGGDRVDFRWYFPSEFDKDHINTLEVCPPSDEFILKSLKTGYAAVQVGANSSNVIPVRFNGEEEKPISAPEGKNANGTETYILGLSSLSDLGDLSNKYVQKFIITSTDVRLKNLTLGNSNKYYYNPYLGTVVDGVSPKIDLTNALYLESFNFYNCSAFNNAIDFSKCLAIQKILLTGSGVTGITLPKGGVLKELRLPTSVTELTIENHNDLTADNFSLGTYNYDTSSSSIKDHKIGFGNGYYENDYSQIIKLEIINTPIDTYSIVKQARSLEKYCLRGINWTITESDTQYCIRLNDSTLTPEQIQSYYVYNPDSKTYELWNNTTYPSNKILYERIDMVVDNKIVCIPVLEQLQTKTVVNSKNHAEALIGNISINIPGVEVDELAIYNKYKDVYPDVKISYGPNMSVDGAYKIKFYYTDINNLPENGVNDLTPYFETLTKGGETLTALTRGKLINPNKNSTAEKVYEFMGVWTDINATTNNIYYQDEFADKHNIAKAKAFSTTYPQSDMNLVPWFAESDRLYTVKFFDYDYKDNNEKNPIFIIQGKYSENLENAININNKTSLSKYQYRSSDAFIGEHDRYTFKGWIDENDYNNAVTNPTIIDLNSVLITSDINLFAYYVVEDARVVPSDINLFNIATSGKVLNTNNSLLTINLDDEYANLIGGKITLPSFDTNGRPIKIVGTLNKGTNITDIYFLNNSEYIKVADSSCRNLSKLNRIYLPNTIVEIGNEAFYWTYSYGGTSILKLEQLPSSIEKLGDRAFAGCTEISISSLPTGLKKIGTQCFSGCYKVSVNNFSNNGLTIGYQAFYHAGNSVVVNDDSQKTIKIENGVTLEKDDEGNYQTFYGGYNHVTALIIPEGATRFDNTSELLANLFNRTTGISVNLM